jgi:hypothetical protein
VREESVPRSDRVCDRTCNPAVPGRPHAEVILEPVGEVGDALETHAVGDLGDGPRAGLEQLGGPLPMGMYWASPVLDVAQVATGRTRELPVLIVTPERDATREIPRRNVAGSIGSISVGGLIAQFIQPLVKPTFLEYAPDGSTAGLAEPVADRRG